MLQKHQSCNHFHRSGLEETKLSYDHHQERYIMNQERLINEHSYGWFVDIEHHDQNVTAVRETPHNHRKILERRKRKRVDHHDYPYQARIVLQQEQGHHQLGDSCSIDHLTATQKANNKLEEGVDWSAHVADIVDNVLSDTHLHVTRTTQRSWNTL